VDASSDSPATVGLATQRVSQLAGVPVSTLDYWVRQGLVKPSVRSSEGRRVTRYWSVRDLVIVRTVRTLREAGCSLQGVRKVKSLIEREWRGDLSSVNVYWDGSDVRAVSDWDQLTSMLHRPNQEVLHLVAVPLEAWASEAAALAEEIDLDVMRQRKRRRPVRPATVKRKLDPKPLEALG
jgi:DNA-binding transcriptional MerR regulator